VYLLLKVVWEDVGDAVVKLVSVLSQVAWIAQSLLFLMSWGRCAFMGDKVSGLQYYFGEGESLFYHIYYRRMAAMMINRESGRLTK